MKTFQAPANDTVTSATALSSWADFQFALCTASMDVFLRQWEVWATAQRAALEMTTGMWGAARASEPASAPPAVCLAAADLRETSAAVLRAQIDAVAAMRQSA